MKDIENPMVIDSHWRHQEKEPKVIAECPGCMEDIVEGEDVYGFEENREFILIHQDSECCLQYIANKSRCIVAGEK